MTVSAASGPRFMVPKGLVRFATDSAYVFQGGSAVEAFAGPGAIDVLPELCDLLDGTRTVEQIATILRIPLSDAVSGINLLARRGLVQQVGHELDLSAADPGSAAMYLERTLGYTGRASNAEEIAGRLRDATVLMVGEGPLPTLVTEELARSGLTVRRYAPNLLTELPPVVGATWAKAIVVEILDSGSGSDSVSLAHVLDSGHLWIGAGEAAAGGFVGPMLHPSMSCRCQLSRLHAPIGGLLPRGAVDLLSPLITAEIVNGLGGGSAVATLNRRVELTSSPDHALRFDTQFLTRSLDCPYCGERKVSSERLLPGNGQTAWSYEQEIETRPPAFHADVIPPPPPNSLEFERRARSLPTCPTIARTSLHEGARIRLAADLLGRTIGVQPTDGGRPWRAVPSAGNLGSSGAFIVSKHEVDALGSHCAWYDAIGDQLVASGKVNYNEVTTGIASVIDVPWDEIIVWVADLAKVAEKYGDFALRLAHLDAGVALSQSLIAAEAADLNARLATRWDADVFSRLLDLDVEREVVTGVMVLSGDREGDDSHE